MGYERKIEKIKDLKKTGAMLVAMPMPGKTDRRKKIKVLSQKHALKATACKSLPLGDNIIITNPYMIALPFVNMKTTTTTTIRTTIMKSNQIMVHVALI